MVLPTRTQMLHQLEWQGLEAWSVLYLDQPLVIRRPMYQWATQQVSANEEKSLHVFTTSASAMLLRLAVELSSDAVYAMMMIRVVQLADRWTDSL